MTRNIVKILTAIATVSFIGLAVGAAEAQTYGGGEPHSNFSNEVNRYYQPHPPYGALGYRQVR